MSQAVVIAVGVAADGRREVFGFDVGDTKKREVLDHVPHLVEGSRTRRRDACYLWRPHRVEESDRILVPICQLAGITSPFHAQRALRRPERIPRHPQPRSSAQCLPNLMRHTSTPRSPRSPRCWADPIQRPLPFSTRLSKTSSRSRVSRSGIGGRSGRQPLGNGSTRRSNAAPTSSMSSPSYGHTATCRGSAGRTTR